MRSSVAGVESQADAQQTWIIIARTRFNLGDKGRPSRRFRLLDRGLSPHRARLVGGAAAVVPMGAGSHRNRSHVAAAFTGEPLFGNRTSLSSFTHQTGADRALTFCGT